VSTVIALVVVAGLIAAFAYFTNAGFGDRRPPKNEKKKDDQASGGDDVTPPPSK
jgi:hypothetical protein